METVPQYAAEVRYAHSCLIAVPATRPRNVAVDHSAAATHQHYTTRLRYFIFRVSHTWERLVMQISAGALRNRASGTPPARTQSAFDVSQLLRQIDHRETDVAIGLVNGSYRFVRGSIGPYMSRLTC